MKPKWLHQSNLKPKWHLGGGLVCTRIELIYHLDGTITYHQLHPKHRLSGGNTKSWQGKSIKRDYHRAMRSDDGTMRKGHSVSRTFSELDYFGT